jgi:hypothetical protein
MLKRVQKHDNKGDILVSVIPNQVLNLLQDLRISGSRFGFWILGFKAAPCGRGSLLWRSDSMSFQNPLTTNLGKSRFSVSLGSQTNERSNRG